MDNQPFAIGSVPSFDLNHGFLPRQAPLNQLPKAFVAWEQFAQSLAKQLLGRQFRQAVEQLPPFPIEQLNTPAEFERAMLLLSFIAHAYVWQDPLKPATQLPSNCAVPWVAVAREVGRPPVLSYASYALYNWRKLDKAKPIELGNIVLLQNFLGGVDEEWFILVHIDIEAKAVNALNAVQDSIIAVQQKECNELSKQLQQIATAMEQINQTLARMPEFCDPFIYYNRVRPYIHGWKNNPALQQGLVYDGVREFEGKPQQYKGETGAQSTIIPVLDALLGVSHQANPLKAHLNEMRCYMPQDHCAFLEYVEQNSIRDFIVQAKENKSTLHAAYNDCLTKVKQFRHIHLEYAAQYIQKQTQTTGSNPTEIGTGGTPFMQYLHQHEQDVDQFHLRP